MDDTQFLIELGRGFAEVVPHNRALGMRVVRAGPSEAWMELPFSQELVGDPRTGVLHGGVVTSLMDACCGAAVFLALRAPRPIATLDLRIDYLRSARPGLPLRAHATCVRVTHHVAFTRGVAYDAAEDDPVAAATGTFMIGTPLSRAEGGP